MTATKILLFGFLFLSLSFAADKLPTCPNDGSSFSNCDEVETTNFRLDLTVDFDKSSLYGTNILTLKALKDGVTKVVLDYQGIIIQKVEQQMSDKSYKIASYSSYTDTVLGSALIISLVTTGMGD